MVKTPRTRHSKAGRDPVTIDLSPGEVSRVKAEQEAGAKTAGASSKDGRPEQKPAGTAEPSRHETGVASTSTAGAEPAAPTQGPDAGKTAPSPRAASEEARGDDKRPTGTASASAHAKSADAKSAEAKAAETRSSTPASSTASQASGSAAASSGGSAFGRQSSDTKPSSASSTPRPAASSAPPASATPAGRGRAALTGAVAGGIVALLVAGGLQMSGFVPDSADGDARVAALETELAALREQIAGLPGADGADVAARVEATDERVAALEAEIETIRETLGSAAASEGSVDLAPIEERIAALESAVDGSADAQTLDGLEEQLATLRSAVDAVTGATSQSESRIAALEETVQDLSGRVEEQAEAPGTALVVAASALKAAIDRGMPFMTELETYASLAPDAAGVEALRDLAATGVATRAEIAARSDAAANAMIAAARPVDPEAGLFDRLWSSALGMVEVRPIGMVEGEEVPAIVARLDAAVQAGDYPRALEEYDALPDAAKAAGSEFIEMVRARDAADRLIDEALSAALRA